MVTALDATSLEAVLDAFEQLEEEGGTGTAGYESLGDRQPLYGISATSKIVYYLGSGLDQRHRFFPTNSASAMRG